MSRPTLTTPTETLPFTEARQNLSQVVNRVARRETRVLVEKSGVPVAAIVSPDDLRRLDKLDADRERLFELSSEISRAFADVPLEELEMQVDLAVAEARAELRAERAMAALGDGLADLSLEERAARLAQALAEARVQMQAEREAAAREAAEPVAAATGARG